MGSLYDRIEKLCERNGINVTTMCREAGVSRGNLTDLKMGRQNGLSAKNTAKIANYFNVSVDYLLSGKEEEKPTAEGSELDRKLEGIDFALYGEVKELTDAQKRDVLRFIQFLKQEE